MDSMWNMRQRKKSKVTSGFYLFFSLKNWKDKFALYIAWED